MRLSAKLCALPGLLLLVVLVAACGGGSSSSSESSSTGGGGGSASGANEADVSTAEERIRPFVGHPSPPFPVDEPLKQPPSSSWNFSQLVFGNVTGAVIGEVAELAAGTAGVPLATVKAGSTASSIQGAAQTIVSQSPDAVLLPAANPETFEAPLKEMEENGAKVCASGIMYPEKSGINCSFSDQRQSSQVGGLLADWVVAKRGGNTNVVLYEVPELNFSPIVVEAFESELDEVCPECTVRTVPIKASEAGSTAPNTIVSDLQANPDTEQVVLVAAEDDLGLPAAMKAAGLEVPVVSSYGSPSTMDYIKHGELEATFAVDFPLDIFTEFDMAMREVAGEPLTAGEKNGLIPGQFLTQEDITFPTEKGYSSDPKFIEKFEELWGVKK